MHTGPCIEPAAVIGIVVGILAFLGAAIVLPRWDSDCRQSWGLTAALSLFVGMVAGVVAGGITAFPVPTLFVAALVGANFGLFWLGQHLEIEWKQDDDGK